MADTNQETNVPNAEQVQTTVRLPEELWLVWKNAAARRRIPQNDVIVEALRQYLNINNQAA